uniref:Putative ovule protein n=1 Tax=Solanum chacoense TaxID=4108 RepID=A0A0V0GUU8_SOLCH
MAKQVEFDPWPHLYANPLVTNHTLAISTTFCSVRNRKDYVPLDQVDPTQISTIQSQISCKP